MGMRVSTHMEASDMVKNMHKDINKSLAKNSEPKNLGMNYIIS